MDKREAQRKYLRPPTVKQIMEFVNECGVTMTAFERYFEFPNGVLRQVKMGNRDLPAKYWSVIYERVIPVYGTKFSKERHVPRRVTNKLPKKRAKLHQISLIDINKLH